MKNNLKIVFGGGCFWCTEAVFKMLKGVTDVEPGYAGGIETGKSPTYEQVCSGDSGYAEVISVDYDPEQVKFGDLLAVFFGSHDPTTKNRQGADIGTQYRSVIFYTTEDQKIEAQKAIEEINSSAQGGDPVVTEVLPLITFYIAENYHRDYFANHKNVPYCSIVINPKLEKIQKQFANLLK